MYHDFVHNSIYDSIWKGGGIEGVFWLNPSLGCLLPTHKFPGLAIAVQIFSELMHNNNQQ